MRQLLVLPLLVTALITPASAEAQTTGPTEVVPTPATRVAKLTGPGSINATDTRWQLKATDLGILWDNGSGRILSAFGDTYGNGWTGPGAGTGDPATLDWRCNTLLRSADRSLADGITFDSAAEDRPGHAKQILDCKKVDRDEHTVIPTAGIAVGNRQYLHYMSVNHWGPAGTWFTNHSGIAYSDDDGQTWTKSTTAIWPNTSAWDNKFQMNAFVRQGSYVYLVGTPNGRFGNAHLARVPAAQVLTKSAYRYWNGRTWSSREADVVPIAIGLISEVSVQWNEHLGRWLMMYLDEQRAAVVLRSAPDLTGPWSGEQVVAKGTDFPALYGTYMHPWSSGADLYFTMSQWDPYNVFLMHTRLSSDDQNTNLVSDPGFEGQPGTTVSAPWQLSGRGGIDRNIGQAHSGANNGFVRESNGWHQLQQNVAIRPHHRYRLSAWIRTSNPTTKGVLGVRTPQGKVLAQRETGTLTAYTKVSVEVEVGANPLIQLYAGTFGAGQDVWLQLDDVVLEEIR